MVKGVATSATSRPAIWPVTVQMPLRATAPPMPEAAGGTCSVAGNEKSCVMSTAGAGDRARVPLDDSRGHPDGSRTGGHIAEDDGHGSDVRAVADGDVSQDLRVRPDVHAVPDAWDRSVDLHVADRHALPEHTVGADDDSGIDDDVAAMPDPQPRPDHCVRRQLDSGQNLRQAQRHQAACRHRQAQPAGQPVEVLTVPGADRAGDSEHEQRPDAPLAEPYGWVVRAQIVAYCLPEGHAGPPCSIR